jgi:hypothetical protein
MSDLVMPSKNLYTPADVKASDFKAKTPAMGSGEEGKDQLFKDSVNQCAPRHAEDGGTGGGYGVPMPTDRSRVIESNFKTQKNTGEMGTSMGTGVSVDFGTGMHASPDQKK